jgi:D-tyrosyl-tRNA(Tyr) deacylase
MARIVIQRVRSASVTVEGEVVGAIDRGLAILVGIRDGDTDEAVNRLADKTATIRIFEDAGGKMNLSPADVGGAMLAVSQFTLYGDVRKGRRPSFIQAARPDEGERLYERFCERLATHGYRVERGRFGAHMLVSLENDGPVTIIVDSEDL